MSLLRLALRFIAFWTVYLALTGAAVVGCWAVAFALAGALDRSEWSKPSPPDPAMVHLSFAEYSFSDLRGEECLPSCPGPSAGFEWARARKVTDVAECRSLHGSFREGCEAYAEEYTERVR